MQQAAQQQVDALENRINGLIQGANNSVHRANESMALAHNANATAIRAFENATQTLNHTQAMRATLEQATARQRELTHQIETVTQRLENEFNRIRENAQINENNRNMHERIQIEQARINALQQLGVFGLNERIQAQASIDSTRIKWEKINQMISDPKNIATVIGVALTIACGIYTAKYFIPILRDLLNRPCVIIETSDNSTDSETTDDHFFIFSPTLKQQLIDLAYRIQTAKTYNENLPNVLFSGPSGTGKTSFAKTLAHACHLDYALTSGSEFAKITDLNAANNELRKLLTWAKKSTKGLIVFIDEAETLFTNKKLPTTQKITLDFINTFLALISERSQKNFMFIFATNYPQKLDEAIRDRIGLHIEFMLPEVKERIEILKMYLKKFAQENEQAIVTICPEVMQALSTYAHALNDFSPRALKFIAEEMIIQARRHKFKQLTDTLAQKIIQSAKNSLIKLKEEM